jgi:DNA-binding transcriptional LysR family regulator
MDIGHLEAFLAVVKEHGFGRAASKLGLTQPAISISIRKLERELGATLFDRYRRDARLTDAGEVLLDFAERILRLCDEAKTTIGELSQLHRGRVTIGANESTNLYLLPKMILAFRERYPDIKVEVFRSSSVQLPTEIKERNLDFGIISFHPEDKELESFPILHDELVLVFPPGHRFTKKRKIAFGELGKETFVAHNVKSPSRDYVINTFRKYGIPLNIGIELSSMETIKDFVQMKLGIAILPKLSVQKELEEKKLLTAKVDGFEYHRTLNVIYLRNKEYSPAARSFIDVLRS